MANIDKFAPFRELTEAKKLEEAPNVTNLLLIARAYSYIKKIDSELTILHNNYEKLQENLKYIQQKDKALSKLLEIYSTTQNPNKLINESAKDL